MVYHGFNHALLYIITWFWLWHIWIISYCKKTSHVVVFRTIHHMLGDFYGFIPWLISYSWFTNVPLPMYSWCLIYNWLVVTGTWIDYFPCLITINIYEPWLVYRWYTGWCFGTWMDYDFPCVLGMLIYPNLRTHFMIFQRGRWLNHQPA